MLEYSWVANGSDSQKFIIDSVYEGAKRAAAARRKKYGASNFGPWTDFEWGCSAASCWHCGGPLTTSETCLTRESPGGARLVGTCTTRGLTCAGELVRNDLG
jgi:hypothetical protein